MKKLFSFLLLILCLGLLASCGKNKPASTPPETADSSPAVPENRTSSAKKEVRMFADYPYYPSLDALKEKTHYIVYAEVLSKSCEMRSITLPDQSMSTEADAVSRPSDDKEMVTTYNIRVIGSANEAAQKDQILHVLASGGEDDDTIYIVEGSPQINLNEKYLFFLSKSALAEDGGWLMNNDQALYSLEGDDAKAAAEGNFEKVFEHLKQNF